MNITITWHGDQFNVELSSKEGADAFLSVKGCRIANGQNGPFVSWPATKNATSGKWWSHVWGSDKFNAAVLEKAQANQPTQGKARSRGGDDLSDVPF
jgi:DNA-binding cell septation regulator SpoVG